MQLKLKLKTERKPALADRTAPAAADTVRERAIGAPAGMPLFLASSIPVQCKLSAGSSEDAAEMEANRMADRAVSSRLETATPPGSRSQPASGPGGRPLDPSVREYFEPRFGADFSGVRIHTENQADLSARRLNAVAFTQGADIAFRHGKYSPETSEGRRLLAHELAHVVQQSSSARPGIQRQADTNQGTPDYSKAEDFLLNYAGILAEELRRAVIIQTFRLGSPYLTWEVDGESRFKNQLAAAMFPSASLRRDLMRALAPRSEQQVLRTIDRVVIDDQTENAVPAVAFELMPSIKQQIDVSLRRIVPRYMAARNQTVLSSSTQSQPSAEPPMDQIPTSAPMDESVAAGLLSGVAAFDELGYRNAFPNEAQPRGNLGIKAPGNIEFLTSQGLWQWVRVGNQDATAEDVAAALYGSPSLAYKIVAAAPLFGFEPTSLIEEPYRRIWRESLEKAGFWAIADLDRRGYYYPPSPLNNIPDGAPRDEMILNQAKTLAPTGATQMEVVQQMRLALGIADQMIAGAGKFKLADNLKEMRRRLDERSKKFGGKDEATAAESWGAQVASQYEILNGAAAGLATAVAELDSYKSGDLPDFVQQPLHNMAAAYVDAASLSEFADSGQQKLAAAHELSQSYSADVLEGALRYIYDSLQAITPDAAENMGGSTSDLVLQEKSLRSELSRIRALIKEDPKRAAELVQELQKKVNKLNSRVAVLNTLSSIDSLTEALKTHVTNIYSTPSAYGMATGMPAPMFGPDPDAWKSDEVKPYNQAIASLAEFRSLWGPIAKTAFTGTDEELAQQLKAAEGRQKDLRATLDNAVQLAKDAEDYDRMFAIYKAFLIGLAIALVTFGVGEIVSGVAIGAGLAEGGAGVFLLSTGAEAITMTTLNVAVAGKEGWENFGTDLIWNFATAGIMKGVGRLYKGVIGAAAAKTALGAAGEFTVTLLAGAVMAWKKAEYDATKKLGRSLTEEEAHAVIRDSILQGIAQAVAMRVAGEFLPNFREAGMKIGGRIKAINEARVTLHAEAGKLTQAKPVNEAAIQDLAGKDSALLEREMKVVQEAEAAPNLSETAKADLKTAKLDIAKATEAAEVGKVLPYLEDAGQNQFLCAQGHLDDVKAFYQKPHAPAPAEPPPGPVASSPPAQTEPPKPPTVTELKPDEVTHARKLLVEPTDGSAPFTVTEKVTPGTEPAIASAKPAESAAKPPVTPPSKKYATLDDILTPKRDGFTEPEVQKKYEEYVKSKNKKGEKPASPEEWAITWTRGSGEAALEKVLGPDFRAQGDAKHMVDLDNFGRPEGLNDTKLKSLWARVSSRTDQFRIKLRNMIAEGIKAGKINVGYFYNCKGLVAEILSEGYQQSILAERQKTQPNARQFSNVYVRRGGVGDPVLFTDGLIGHPEGNGLNVTDRFEVKSGPGGGEQAARQYFKWVESHMEDGTQLLLNRRPAVAGETLAPGQERIGNMVYDVYYWNPTKNQSSTQPQLRTVTGLSGGGTLHAIMPEGGTVLSAESGEHTVPIKVQTLPATASEINYLARLMIEQIAGPQSGAAASSAAGETPGMSKATGAGGP